MDEQKNPVSLYTRRDFGRLALASLPAAGLLGRPAAAWARQAKPNSTWGGVPFGIFAPYRFGPEASDLVPALQALVRFGVSHSEVNSAMIEKHLGAPQAAAAGRGGRAAQTPEQQAAARSHAESLSAWRASVPMSRFAEVRTMFDGAGVAIYAYRLTLRADMPDAEYDYTFNAAKALGASQITMEQPSDRALSQRIGDAAARHQVNVGYHLHTTASITAWDEVMAQSPRNGIQLDIGHFVGGRSASPVPLIERHHARIFSMHLKDKTNGNRPTGGNVNQPWGQGDTPIREVLQLLKKNQWAIPVGIEFEYPVPEGSTWEKEIARCVQYGKDALA
jgi:sugar phosphate isomerase/epimerase